MKHFFRLLKSDFMKMRHTMFYTLHIAIPVIIATLILVYYALTGYSNIGKIQAFIEMIAISFPFVGALMVSMSMESEAQAGNFKELLSCEFGKTILFISKLSCLLINGIIAVTIAMTEFYIGFTYILGQNPFKLSFYVEIWLVLIVGQIFEYIFHCILSIWYGQGITIAVGILETLIAALMLTGLGDGIWKVIPCSWSARLCDYSMLYYSNKEFLFTNMQSEFWMIAIFTIISFIIALGLFNRFEGRIN
ncbi:MAG: lantibiotic immunity ABC transporter MutG family permease subunit [Lachnotalea sp.]